MHHRRPVEVLDDVISYPYVEWLFGLLPTDAFSCGFAFIDRADMTFAEEISWILFPFDFDGHDVTVSAVLIRARQLRFVLFSALQPR